MWEISGFQTVMLEKEGFAEIGQSISKQPTVVLID